MNAHRRVGRGVLGQRAIAALIAGLGTVAPAGCGGGAGATARGSQSSARTGTQHASLGGSSARGRGSTPVRSPAPPRRALPSYPVVLGNPLGELTSRFLPLVAVGGRTATSIARTPSGVTLLRFDQHVVSLALHSGTVDAGPIGWRYGPSIAGGELRTVVAAFNGGFKLDTGAGGFESYGRIAVPLRAGLGSIVTYTDGYTDIGAWQRGVPAPGRRVASVRQNLTLLVAGGAPAANLDCLECWGATLGGVLAPARSALGITPDGHLIWAGGENLTVSTLADALVGAGVTRAVELDINPEWVAAYVYVHHSAMTAPVAEQVVPGQPGVPGQFLAPYSRDFFAVLAR